MKPGIGCKAALLSALTAAAVIPGPAHSQPALERESITVIGQSPPALRKEVGDYVQQLGIVPGERPVSRWVDRVCPEVVGLGPEQAARVEEQVRSIVAEIKAPLASTGCKGNLVIAFTSDPPAVVRQISHRQVLGTVSYEQRKDLETSSAPVRWWYNDEILGADGMPTQGGVFSPALRTEGDGSRDSDFNYNAVLAGDHTGTSNSRTASLINQSGMRAIRQATVVIDARQAATNALTSLVDYAAFVGLAEIRPGAATRSSILDLFTSGEFHRLSRNDLALLKGLYSLQLTRKADQHRRVLIAAILKERLEEAAATGR